MRADGHVYACERTLVGGKEPRLERFGGLLDLVLVHHVPCFDILYLADDRRVRRLAQPISGGGFGGGGTINANEEHA